MPEFNISTARARMNELMGQRADLLKNAEAALAACNTVEYRSIMDKIKNMDPQLDDYKALVHEYDAYDISHAPVGDIHDSYDRKNMGEMLAAHKRVGFTASNVLDELRKNSLLYSGALITPKKAGSEAHDGFHAQTSTLIDQVQVENMEGFSAFEEPYLKTMPAASVGTPEAVAGVTPVTGSGVRVESAPVWKKAGGSAYNANITTYADLGISRLSPVAYLDKCEQLAYKALRKVLNGLILNGDSETTHRMFGILNAQNTAGETMVKTDSAVTAINEATLRKLVFGYGGDEEVSGIARLILSKSNLAAFGDITTGEGDNNPLYEIVHNGNVGSIKLGGVSSPWTIASQIGSKLAFGDPTQYKLALFSALTVRTDESYKAGERMLTILGDVMVSGNLISDQAFTVATISG